MCRNSMRTTSPNHCQAGRRCDGRISFASKGSVPDVYLAHYALSARLPDAQLYSNQMGASARPLGTIIHQAQTTRLISPLGQRTSRSHLHTSRGTSNTVHSATTLGRASRRPLQCSFGWGWSCKHHAPRASDPPPTLPIVRATMRSDVRAERRLNCNVRESSRRKA